MKKIMLFLLLAISNIAYGSLFEIQESHVYSNVPLWCYTDDDVFKTIMICAAWAAKFTDYTFEEVKCCHGLTVVAYNFDCIFCLRFDRENRECEIEFSAEDDTFDYYKFKHVMDFYFLYN